MSGATPTPRIEWVAQPQVGQCWAACAHMLAQASGAPVPALEIIVAKGRALASDTDAALHDHELTALLAALGLRTAFVERALGEDELRAVLDAGRPVIAVHAQSAEGDGEAGHAVVVASRAPSGAYRVLDPILGERHVAYDAALTPDAGQRWCMTWSLLAPTAVA